MACTHMTDTTPVTCRHAATSSLAIKIKTLQQKFLERAPKQGGGDVPVARLQGYSRANLFFRPPPRGSSFRSTPPALPLHPYHALSRKLLLRCLVLLVPPNRRIYACEYDSDTSTWSAVVSETWHNFVLCKPQTARACWAFRLC